MKKFSFKNDYSEGAHPAILNALVSSNLAQQSGYGDDEYTQEAVQLIKQRIENPEAGVFLVSGGTQANLIVIASILRPHESVIAATTGHINVHEAGAIEATGHRIEAVPTPDGKLRPEDIFGVLGKFEEVHMTRPRLVYISNATEIGTMYSRQELVDLSACCREHHLYLFMDGARLGSALCAETNDITFADLARYTDVFYIGGTKNGALLGEAIVINHRELQNDFQYHLKQRGALMAKGRLLGVQFAEMFRSDLFFEMARHANQAAAKLSAAIQQLGFPLLTVSYTNQIFPILPADVIEQLLQQFDFYRWQKIDAQQTAIRLVTSWATPDEAVDQFIEVLTKITGK
ncbi:aminotransferase class I/II-fold pyridoxal phosphate-dependent enzyme [Mucilaginibacter robiniae]|uniref:Aminotransferase class I/II-fold pyridoxal phosphate-dependent enzyme n=1 Tax=Mucilaginibacter robiniae TaxID=2728022 RepID=A0A7L5DZT8_9SPHI|nr:aminotransferase class I/II-fold pyridoxal phosphate-dependent enzyme [Mucilaginibacter robiniae]QJD95549.1 aminotransferase class I/II-fold pyridoxal phosphate-dependent enzyme [Mucilaginibacter robiniae]